MSPSSPTTPGPDTPPGPWSARYRTITSALVGLVTIIAFEEMAVSTVMPAVAVDLGAGAGYGLGFSAVFTAQLLGIVLARPWIARSGPLPPTWIGQIVFAIGSVLAGVATTFDLLLLGRAATGLGAGLVIVALYVAIGDTYDESTRPAVFAWISAAWVVPSIVGPLLAAALASLWSWRAVFLAVVPAVVLTAVGLWRTRHELRAGLAGDVEATDLAETDDREQPWRIARLGLAVAVGAGIVQAAGTRLVPASAGPVVLTLAGFVVLAVALPRLLPTGALVARRGLPAVVLARGLFNGTFSVAVTFVPLMLQSLRGFDDRGAGVVLALGSLGWSAAAAVQGRSRFSGATHGLVAVGAGCLALGSALLSLTAAAGLPTAAVVAGTTLLGIGMGFGSTSVSVLTLRLAAAGERAAASSALTLSDTLGAIIGVTATGVAYATFRQLGHTGPSAFAGLWLATTGLGAVTVLVARRTSPRAVRRT